MIKIEHLSKTFKVSSNAADNRKALVDVNLTIEDGDFITIIGGNGSGKSTLLNMIAGVYPVDEGHIILKDKDITKLKEHQRAKYIGRVFQNPLDGSMSNMSIIENLALASRRGKIPGFGWNLSKKDKDKYAKLLEPLNLDLSSRLNTKIGLLSGGQRQALTLLMATLKRPDVLLLDEHTAALDPKTARIVLDLTNKIVNEGKLTAVMVTHNMKDAIECGNRLIMMGQGRVILDIKGEEKAKLTVNDLIKKFQSSGEDVTDDMALSN